MLAADDTNKINENLASTVEICSIAANRQATLPSLYYHTADHILSSVTLSEVWTLLYRSDSV